MGQRQALLLTTFLTVFGLVLIGAVAWRLTAGEAEVNQVETDNAVLTETAPIPNVAVSTPDQDAVNALIESREAAYQEALREANERLAEAYSELQSQGTAPATAPAPAPVDTGTVTGETVSTAPTYAVSPDQAASIALSLAPGANINATPELVSFEGTVAYEVNTSAGLIYVDANTGAVLFNGAAAAPAPAPVQSAPPAGGGTVPIPPVAPAPGTPQISADQAVAVALAYTGGGNVERVKLEEEHGALVYEVRYTNDTKVYVDPVTGQVLFARVRDDNGGDDNSGHGGDDDHSDDD